MENKKNRKVKIFLLGVIVLGVCNFVGVEHVFAQGKQKDIKVIIKKDVNSNEMKLSANGKEVEAKCVKTTCTAGYRCSKWRCFPNSRCSDNGDGSMRCSYTRFLSGWCHSGDDTNETLSISVHPSSACETSVSEKRVYKAGKGCVDEGSQRVASNRECVQQVCNAAEVCSEWEIQADSVLSLMPDVGLSMIDPNLIEY